MLLLSPHHYPVRMGPLLSPLYRCQLKPKFTQVPKAKHLESDKTRILAPNHLT